MPLALAYLVAALLDDLLAIPVIALASGTKVAKQFRSNLDLRLGGFAVRFVVAACTLLDPAQRPRLLLAVPPLVLSLHLAYSSRIRGRTEQQAWQRLARTTDALNVVDLDKVLTTAVTQAAELFSADEVEIELREGDRTVRGGTGGITFDGPTGTPTDGGRHRRPRAAGRPRPHRRRRHAAAALPRPGAALRAGAVHAAHLRLRALHRRPQRPGVRRTGPASPTSTRTRPRTTR